MTFLTKFVHDETGAAAAEYALILAVVGGAIAVAGLALSTAISGEMTETAKVITDN